MQINIDSNSIYIGDNERAAQLVFEETPCEIRVLKTFVDESLRGRGIAGLLMEEAENLSKKKGKTLVGVCSYAVDWLKKRGENSPK